MIPGLPQVGGLELFILMVIILLFFGAKRVPELARSLGKGKQEFRKGVEEAEAEAKAGEEQRESAEARRTEEESPSPQEARSEDGSVPEGEKPKAEPSSKA